MLTGSDVLVTPGLLKAKFRLPLRHLICPPLRRRQELAALPADAAIPGAVLARASLDAVAAAATGARTLVGVTRTELLLGAVSALCGAAAVLLLAITGRSDLLACAKALAFAAAWALISLLAMLPALKK